MRSFAYTVHLLEALAEIFQASQLFTKERGRSGIYRQHTVPGWPLTAYSFEWAGCGRAWSNPNWEDAQAWILGWTWGWLGCFSEYLHLLQKEIRSWDLDIIPMKLTNWQLRTSPTWIISHPIPRFVEIILKRQHLTLPREPFSKGVPVTAINSAL